jgi:hypothetical protein
VLSPSSLDAPIEAYEVIRIMRQLRSAPKQLLAEQLDARQEASEPSLG